MTTNGWLATRIPEPPPVLAGRIGDAMGERGHAPQVLASSVLVDAAEASLSELLRRDSVGRESAVDLLTVDSLVTYAFEAASLDPATLLDRAEDAMRRFAVVARA